MKTRRSAILLVIALIAFLNLLLLHPSTLYPLHIPGQLQSDHVPSTAPHRRLHFLLPINERAARASSRFCKTLLSAFVHGYQPIILNWETEGDVLFTHRMKVHGVYQYLTNLTADADSQFDLVFMADALDVWFQLSPASLMARYDELGTAGVVVGAEKACWPNMWESAACQDVPESPLPKGTYGSDPGPELNYNPHTRPRWANSGLAIGPVLAMRELYKKLVEVFHDPSRDSAGDQGPFNEMHSAGHLSIDYRSRLFWQTAAALPKLNAHFLSVPYPIDPTIPHVLYPPLLHLGPTGEIPVAIHFNDHTEKVLMEEWWGEFWWNKLRGVDQRFRGIVESRLEGAVVRFAGDDGHRETWKEICPETSLSL